MSEHLNKSTESTQEHIRTNESEAKRSAEHIKLVERQAENSKIYSHEEVRNLERAAELQAVSSEEIDLKNHTSSSHNPPQFYRNREITEMTYQRLLIRVRKHLNAPQRLMSQIIHLPAIEQLSETGSKTVARPSGILGGGIVALAGTSAYYFLTKNYGYNYNYFIFIALLILGFGLGWSMEIILKLRRSR